MPRVKRRSLPSISPLVAGLLLATLAACDEPKPKSAPGTAKASAPLRHVEIVAAADGEDVAVVVKRELARAQEGDRDLVVYVGAPWCEPCTRFHEAALAGALDAAFPRLRLLEFNLDRDRERLASAGYGSRLIPLFAKPDENGRDSGLRIEGSIKGEGAIAEITPRLRALLQRR